MVRFPGIYSFARTPASFVLLALAVTLRLPAADAEFDVVIYGGNAAGAVAALQVSRMGGSVVLLEPGPALGGLTTGGLGATDVGDPNAIGAIAHEFYRGLHTYYSAPSAWRSETRAAYGPRHPLAVSDATKLHWFFEPHVATKILHELLAEARVPYHLKAQLDRTRGVHRDGTRITEIALVDGRTFRGRTFIDTTYEGDLMAAAGVSYIVGREANRRYSETLNGVHVYPADRTPPIDPFVRPGDRTSGLLPRVAPRAPGAEGEADAGMQAYNFRVCLTDVADNRVPFIRPATYNALNYEITLRSIAGQTVRPGPQLFTLTPMPNRKTDTNNRGLFSTDYVGRSQGWAEASYAEREALWQEHKDYTQGFFWFLANDPRVPEAVRREVGRWGLARDEFTDTEHWPFQLYVREARRMLGEYVVTEHDCRRKTTVTDPVAHASYAMDSHVVGHFVDVRGRLRVEGTFLENIRAFPISYRALLPKRTECTNLIVPVCLSTSHVAYGSVRMEPVFMMLGQSAATAAMLAQQQHTTLHELRYEDLRTRLLADGQVLALPVRAARIGTAGVRGEPPADAVAAIEKLHRLDFFAPADASTNFWRNAARPGAACETERVAALIIAAAQRFERDTTRVEDAITVLKKRDNTLDAPTWLAHTQTGGTWPGEAVADLLKTLANAF